MNTEPREVISNIVAQLVITHGDLLSVQAAIERSALNTSFHESEIRNLQKLDHATQFVDAITIILRNFMDTACHNGDRPVSLDSLLQNVQLGSVRGLFTGKTSEPPSSVGEVDFF
ncbi:hypothetical protein C0V97_07665 [Asaia sp. W19]|uniref:hypothetical protein n=1 Tax=unclassified Asaia TaxID=2685023 RepID=UPI000F8E3319|nr:hypothetical protein [Asaia sp. W19]RUT26240.1 hypothetical protein C0V97_07665 [Asaia sp. W19]